MEVFEPWNHLRNCYVIPALWYTINSRLDTINGDSSARHVNRESSYFTIAPKVDDFNSKFSIRESTIEASKSWQLFAIVDFRMWKSTIAKLVMLEIRKNHTRIKKVIF